jgi:hypothetical protein
MLSAVSFSACDPIGLTYPHDQSFKLSQNLYAFADGFNMYIAPLLAKARDIKLNKHEIAILSDYVNLENCVDQAMKSDTPIQITTTVEVPGVGYWACTDEATLSITPDKISETNVFIFQFDPATQTVRIIFGGDNFLTYSDATNTLSFQNESVINFNGVSPQIFNYILDGDQIVLFTNFAFLSSQYTLTYNTSSNVLSATRTLDVSGTVPANSTFTIAEYPNDDINDYKYGQSNWVQYGSTDQNLSIKTSISSIPQNILITSPYKNLSGNQFQANVNGLKNHLTPDYELNIDSVGSVNQRDYYGIFTGTGQEEGYDNIFLSYEGGTQGITFKKDRYTWFHFPNTSESININNTTLAFNGAVASNTPYKSDKVFKKRGNYKKYSNWGESLPVYEQDGTWLCTWLSGSPDPDTVPVWIDRYLNPTLTGLVSSADDLVDLLLSTNTEAFIGTTDLSGLEINGNVFVAKLFNTFQQSYVDIPSQLTFDPGVLYVYHHIGETDNRSIVSQLSGSTKQYFVSGGEITSNTLDGTGQMLYVSDWSTGTTVDKSPTRNDIIIVNTPSVKSDDEVVYNTLFTNGSAYGITTYPVNLAPYEGFALSVNIYADDWSNLYGDQIVGNFFDGGVGLFVDNPALTPLFYVYETTQGRNLELNSDLYILQESKLSNVASTSAVQFIFRRNHEDEYFVIDSGKNVLRYDSANILLSANSLSGTITGNILDAQIDGIGNLYILATDGAYRFAHDTGQLEYLFSAGSSTRIAVDIANNVSVLDSHIIDYCVDSQNNMFTVSNTNVYKNGELTFTATDIKKIYCDLYDNIWLLHNNKLTKLTNVPTFLTTTTLSSNGNMSMTLGYHLSGNGGVEEYIIVVDETNRRITKLSMDNQIISSTLIDNLSGQFIITGTMVFRISRGDPSGYDYQRKFGRVRQREGKGVHIKLFTNHRTTLRTKLFTLYADTSKLTKGWHNFIISFDTPRGNIKLLIDGEVVARTSSDVNAYQFTYRTSNYRNEPRIMIGSSSAKNGTLNEKIRQPGTYIFNGGFNEVRLYNEPLNEYNLRYVSRNGYVEAYDDMVWNMPVGSNQYLEEIERFFQHRLPGNKSQFFNLKIRGYQPSTPEVQQIFEDSIRQVITKIVPAYTQLKDIVWIP